MGDFEKTDLRSRLNELSDRLSAREAELRKYGEFSEEHRLLLTEMQRRSDALRRRVEEAESGGSAWQLIRTEFARDFGSLYDDLLQLEDRLDSEAVKKRQDSSDAAQSEEQK
ncbi:MAG: hypothetical protein QHD01_11245 [Bradyrhizobium sp.]|uniref:hypothetical protein n=1 Tax=Bradyrhizobium sp. TaxID=376 RepID=UPI0029B9076C|nr:hypothetical protein [Bradyrhizobium sp.]MDX3967160.1 hypothetical protein [Bradyrhizobium sp.]